MSASKSDTRPLVDYLEVTDPQIINKIRKRYQSSIEAFSEISINEITYYEERTPPLGLITLLPIGIMAFRDGVIDADRTLSFSICYPVLFDRNNHTIIDLSFPSGKTFFTRLSNAKWCISTKNPQSAHSQLKEKVLLDTFPDTLSEKEALVFHQGHVERLKASGYEVDTAVQLENYIALNYQADQANEKTARTLTSIWTYFVSIVFFSVLGLVINKLWPTRPDGIDFIRLTLTFLLPFAILFTQKRVRY